MTRRRIPHELKAEAMRLRRERRMSLGEISRETGISKGTLSLLLRDEPLTAEERQRRRMRSGIQATLLSDRYSPEQSKFHRLVAGEELTREQKGQIAETAVLFRLALLRYEVWRPDFAGNRIDWLVSRPGGRRRAGIQVRWAARGKYGRPAFSARKRSDRGPLGVADRDVIAAYDLETDTVYVVPIADAAGVALKTCDEQYAEAWHLLGLD